MDELHTEEDARMDALEDRTRALAARVGVLAKERDTARASADRWHGVAHQMEVERDAAVKALEEAEREKREILHERGAFANEVFSLRAQLAEAREREGRERGYKADIGNMLQSAIGTLRGIAQAKRFDREVFADDSAFVDWAVSRARWEVTAYDSAAKDLAARAALSPSPATFDGFMAQTEAEAERDGMIVLDEAADVPAEVWAATLTPSPASGVVETSGEPFCACGRRWSDCDGSRSGCWAPGKDGDR